MILDSKSPFRFCTIHLQFALFFFDEKIVNAVGESLGVHQYPYSHEELLVGGSAFADSQMCTSCYFLSSFHHCNKSNQIMPHCIGYFNQYALFYAVMFMDLPMDRLTHGWSKPLLVAISRKKNTDLSLSFFRPDFIASLQARCFLFCSRAFMHQK